ncbi:hypothetical protein LCI18_004721 [Fusarium solani-melongenae]|uniref:Uncharacterized protein n=1 Tax=Fusarium solani subsp. cucurbitae TaxID=2747967 RepID=A0ACD3YYT8_FUSSC|nr:hypothetical protein LCI18_004721 [Fusarium solani-melongenae]
MSTSLFSPPPPGIYEYTEVLTFHFSDTSVPPALSDENTAVGKVWAFTLKTYLEQEQTGIVYWTLINGSPQRAKLFIDWKTSFGRDQFELSTELENLRMAWSSVTSAPVHSVIYRLPWGGHRGHPGLHSSYDTVSSLFTFNFPVTLTDEDKEKPDHILSQFARSVLQSPGGVVSSYCTTGWDVNNTSCCGIFRYIGIQEMQSFLQQNQIFEELRSLATNGTEVEFMEVRCYAHGWQGSVDKTYPENPASGAFFASMRELSQAIGPREPGRPMFG